MYLRDFGDFSESTDGTVQKDVALQDRVMKERTARTFIVSIFFFRLHLYGVAM